MLWKRKKQMEAAKNDNSKIEEMQMAAVKIQMEYLMLQSQINPHFLYNTLDSIRSEALKNKQVVIAEMIERLSKFFRYCISSRGDFVRLSEELNHINDYFYIQKFRFEDRIELYTQIENEDLLNYYIPKMTLQPIVENSISHGLEKKLEPGVIHLDIKSSEKKLYITLSDNGVGMSREKLSELNKKINSFSSTEALAGTHKSGIALTNVNARIHLCFGNEYGLRIRSMEGEGTQIEITVPLVDDFNLVHYEKNNTWS
jgi:two-component system sensor histidine kinase YesM